MAEFTPEMLEKAKAAESPEALLALAKDSGVEDFTLESAEAYFALLHPATGEVSDDELENVSGGGCYNKGELVVTLFTSACEDGFVCKHCGKGSADSYLTTDGIAHRCNDKDTGLAAYARTTNSCGVCKYCEYKRGLWLCTNPKKRK